VTQWIVHGNAGVGTTQGPVVLTAELANYAIDSNGAKFIHELAAGVRYGRGALVPYASYAFTFDLDEGGSSAHSIIGGVEGTF